MSSTLSKIVPIIALAAAIALAATACGGNDEERLPGERATAAPATGSGAPTRQLGTAPAPANVTVPKEMETAARKLLAEELDVDEGVLRLKSSEGMQWSDASLGCPQEGMMYAQVITPGYKLVFGLAGKPPTRCIPTRTGRTWWSAGDGQ